MSDDEECNPDFKPLLAGYRGPYVPRGEYFPTVRRGPTNEELEAERGTATRERTFEPPRPFAIGPRRYQCGLCGGIGHNRNTCSGLN